MEEVGDLSEEIGEVLIEEALHREEGKHMEEIIEIEEVPILELEEEEDFKI